MPHALAIDLGGTKIAAAAINSSGRMLAKIKRPVDRRDTLSQITTLAAEALHAAALDWPDMHAAGLIVPGIYFARTGNVWAPNLFGHEEVPLGRELAARLPVPAVIDSDRAGYVTGEQWMGSARGLSDVVFLAVGTGIGAGILTGGRLCRGASDIAGAVGWFALDPRRQPHWKQTGCWEGEAAGPAVARRSGVATAEEAVAAARRGEPAACRALEETARWLGMGIANLVSLLNPEMVVLGGGLMEGAGDLLLDAVRKEVIDWAQPIAARQVRIELTELGADAGLLGAARLALDHVR